jgi:hypothetical protein
MYWPSRVYPSSAILPECHLHAYATPIPLIPSRSLQGAQDTLRM